MVNEASRLTFLVVDETVMGAHALKQALSAPGRRIYDAASASEAIAALHRVDPDLILLSLDLTEMAPMRAVARFRQLAPEVPIIGLQRGGTVHAAVSAMRHGVADYVSVPFSDSDLEASVKRALQEAWLGDQDPKKVQEAVHDRYGFTTLLTQSPRMVEVFEKIRAVASTDATVLIRGETGTGKELVSRAIHDRSQRKDKPFISVNCGAFTETLLESELFGHEKGSFTGAVERRAGLFEMADGGTLFLDELGETTLNVQVNLLRVLETMTFRRVGGRDYVEVDVRIVAATNVGLEDAIENGEFREDLYYRLNVFPITLPPLRKRREDIPLLMRHFLEGAGEEYGREPPVVSSDAMEAILTYRWPGNVRQLRALCERWVIAKSGGRLERADLPRTMLSSQPVAPVAEGVDIEGEDTLKEAVDKVVRGVERAYLFKALKQNRGHLGQTADEAGITRRTLYTKMKQYGWSADDFKLPE